MGGGIRRALGVAARSAAELTERYGISRPGRDGGLLGSTRLLERDQDRALFELPKRQTDGQEKVRTRTGYLGRRLAAPSAPSTDHIAQRVILLGPTREKRRFIT